MAKKRRRRKKSKKPDDGFYVDGEESPQLAKGEEFLDDNVFRLAKLLGIRVKRALFKDAGYVCNTDQWVTNKVGANGRNAMRAHLKKHVNERRAENHLRIFFWAGVLLVLCVLILSADSKFDLRLSRFFQQEFTWSDAAGPILVVASLLAAFGLLRFEILYGKNPTKQKKTGYFISLILASAVITSEVVLVSGLIDINIDWLWYLSGLIPIGALALTRSEFAFTSLHRSRRMIRSQKYVRLFRAITEHGDDEFMKIQDEIRQKIRNNEFSLKNLKPWQTRALNRLRIVQ